MVLFIQCSITQIKRSNCRINDTVWIAIIQTIIPHTIVAINDPSDVCCFQIDQSLVLTEHMVSGPDVERGDRNKVL